MILCANMIEGKNISAIKGIPVDISSKPDIVEAFPHAGYKNP